VGKSTSVENGLRLAKLLIDAPIVAHVFLDLRVSEGLGLAVIGGNHAGM
jgi:hypothetical protein